MGLICEPAAGVGGVRRVSQDSAVLGRCVLELQRGVAGAQRGCIYSLPPWASSQDRDGGQFLAP